MAHQGAVWTPGAAKGSWGDIIPGSTVGGSYNWWTVDTSTPNTQGQNVFNGLVVVASTGKRACRSMTLKEFYDSEIAAGQTPSQIADDLNDGTSYEDQAYLAQTNNLSFTAGNLTTIIAQVEVFSAVTKGATQPSVNSAIFAGTFKTSSSMMSYFFEYTSVSADVVGDDESTTCTSLGFTNSTEDKSSQTVLLTTNTTYYYRAVLVLTSECSSNAPTTIFYGETYSLKTGSINYTVNYDKDVGNGTPPTDPTLYPSGSTAPILGPGGALTGPGGTAFLYWSTVDPNPAAAGLRMGKIRGNQQSNFLKATRSNFASGTTYNPGESTTITSNLTLYAVYADPTYTVTYNAKNSNNSNPTSGSAPTDSSSPYSSGATVTILGNTGTPALALTGYTFAGWCTTNTAANVTSCNGTQYSAGDTFVIAANVNLYAVWSAASQTITYNNNTGSGSESNTTGNTGSSVTLSSGSNLSKSGYTLSGWCTTAPTAGSACTSGTPYALSASITMPAGGLALYAVWTIEKSFFPSINSVSKLEVCAIGSELVITGENFEGGKLFLDGIELEARYLSSSRIDFILPRASGGDRVVRVVTPRGTVSFTIKYVDAPKPIFIPIAMPYMSQGDDLKLPIRATNATSYSLIGNLPQGLVFDSTTGMISGKPNENGIFGFVVTARGICGETSQLLELDIDKKTPNAISHRINFTKGASCINESAKASLDAFLEKVKSLAPRNLIPEIYISGGGVGSGSDLGDDRRDCLCEVFLDQEFYGNILEGEFIGATNRVEIIVYWARP